MSSEAFVRTDIEGLSPKENHQGLDEDEASSCFNDSADSCSDDSGSDEACSGQPTKRRKPGTAASAASSHRSGKGSRGGYSNLPCTFAGCSRVFNRSSRLLNHIRTHTKEKPFQCPFVNCPKRYSREDHLNRHLVSHAPRPLSPLDGKPLAGPFTCTFPDCNKSFSSKDYLKIHSKAHKEPHQYKCTWEGCTFATNKHKKLYLHKCRHENILPYPCPNADCDKRFPTPNKRDIHTITHTVTKLYMCGYASCEARFDKWSLLQAHLTNDHVLSCSVCHKVFSSNSGLKRHVRSHASDKPGSGGADLRIKCPYDGCTSSFRQKKNLAHHVRTTHQSHESHACPIHDCEFVFLSEGRLQTHLQQMHPQILLPHPPATEAASQPPPSMAPGQALFDSLIGRSQPSHEAAPLHCPVQLCPARYKQTNMLEKHLATVHKVAIPASLRDEEMEATSAAAQITAILSRHAAGPKKSALDLLLESSVVECSTAEASELPATSIEADPDSQVRCTFPNCHRQYKNLSSLYRHRKHDHPI